MYFASLCAVYALFESIGAFGYLLPGELRNVVTILGSRNGGPFGSWRDNQYCPRSTYAVGYQIKVEQSVGSHDDDTALNGISLVCANLDGEGFGTVSSGFEQFGSWYGIATCPHGLFMIQFNFRVEPYLGHGDDDTTANDIEFICDRSPNTQAVIHAPEGTTWGSWALSSACPLNSGICGIQTKIESYLSHNEDDTTLNDVKMFCCDD
ncbi:vitelline membrane outer layer protein 1-like isoform X1 [Dreissena polymorpha]|uniref:Vitelline membrane outer layer protein 1 n=1 Tax=Dreissena polymorpha TaxID=45954 RepID=A0A9D4IP27_DREPO|nr:vitelline membrane outer layer protein 1-like isoform X1 [Dreissena polymorpha]KAH3782856.1 hypothetical protein DPMN_160776 [Dreissena polymorpha]